MANSTVLYIGSEGRLTVDVDFGDKVLTLADQGIVQNVIKDGVTVTPPATSAGASFLVRNGGLPAAAALGSASGASGGVGFNVSPNSADKIQGAGLTAADNKDLQSVKANSSVGDEVKLVGDGIDGYNIEYIKGTVAQSGTTTAWIRET